jgi:hypothetical protein
MTLTECAAFAVLARQPHVIVAGVEAPAQWCCGRVVQKGVRRVRRLVPAPAHSRQPTMVRPANKHADVLMKSALSRSAEDHGA